MPDGNIPHPPPTPTDPHEGLSEIFETSFTQVNAMFGIYDPLGLKCLFTIKGWHKPTKMS